MLYVEGKYLWPHNHENPGLNCVIKQKWYSFWIDNTEYIKKSSVPIPALPKTLLFYQDSIKSKKTAFKSKKLPGRSSPKINQHDY